MNNQFFQIKIKKKKKIKERKKIITLSSEVPAEEEQVHCFYLLDSS